MKSILIVEDHAEIAEMLSTLLQLGAKAVSVQLVTKDFGEVLNVEAWDGVDIGVIDMMLPQISGPQILEWMISNVPDVRRVIYSARDVTQEEREMAHAVVQKGADYRTLTEGLGL